MLNDFWVLGFWMVSEFLGCHEQRSDLFIFIATIVGVVIVLLPLTDDGIFYECIHRKCDVLSYMKFLPCTKNIHCLP
jgi:hypothetical protein